MFSLFLVKCILFVVFMGVTNQHSEIFTYSKTLVYLEHILEKMTTTCFYSETSISETTNSMNKNVQ